ncbi:MAG: ATP-dependent helicase C-terminal domain-containing protein, partial [Pseudomonadota bacterium]
GLRRPGEAPRYLLSGGRGAVFSAEDPLAATRLIVAADLDDKGREATIRLAARLEEAVLREVHGYRIAWVERAEWSRRSRRVEARSREMFGALALDDRLWRDAPAEALAAALAEGIRERGIATLAFSPAAQSLRARIAWLRAREGHSTLDGLPDWSDAALLKSLDDWLTPYLAGMTRIEDIASLDLAAILKARLDPTHLAEIERAAPAHLITPLGERARIDYDADIPTLRVRVQEVFGLDTHPTVGVPPVALKIELLSPARRPVQTTRDLPGFWHSSYRDVAKDMRARYPRHPWPDDPLAAFPTRRTKPR